MKQSFAILSILLSLTYPGFTQQTVFGANNYIEYQIGTLPVVISVPHGGGLVPSDIPNRTCNNPTTVTDAFTIETANEIKKSLYAMTGCYPHIIICHLKRTKLDCNRNISDGACNNNFAEVAWNEFQNFIIKAQNTANQQYNNNTFYVDLHGHGNPIQRIELGYLLYDDELELSDSLLNMDKYIDYSSISCLTRSNTGKFTHAQLLRGTKAFGTLLGNEGYPSVPSEQIPFPGTKTSYFRGGYNTANHTCFAQDIVTQGVQMELNFNGIRDTPSHRTSFADKFSTVIAAFLKIHTQVIVNNCKPLATQDDRLSSVTITPNPVCPGQIVSLKGIETAITSYKIINSLGQILSEGTISQQQDIQIDAALKSGVYFIVTNDQKNKMMYRCKLLVQ